MRAGRPRPPRRARSPARPSREPAARRQAPPTTNRARVRQRSVPGRPAARRPTPPLARAGHRRGRADGHPGVHTGEVQACDQRRILHGPQMLLHPGQHGHRAGPRARGGGRRGRARARGRARSVPRRRYCCDQTAVCRSHPGRALRTRRHSASSPAPSAARDRTGPFSDQPCTRLPPRSSSSAARSRGGRGGGGRSGSSSLTRASTAGLAKT